MDRSSSWNVQQVRDHVFPDLFSKKDRMQWCSPLLGDGLGILWVYLYSLFPTGGDWCAAPARMKDLMGKKDSDLPEHQVLAFFFARLLNKNSAKGPISALQCWIFIDVCSSGGSSTWELNTSIDLLVFACSGTCCCTGAPNMHTMGSLQRFKRGLIDQ